MNPLPPIILPTGHIIGDDQPCFIVAEIGQNHNGDVYTATRLMAEADTAGVDGVKFTKRHILSDLTRAARDAPYDNENSFGATYGEHREALELSIDEYKHLKARAEYNEWPAVLFVTVCDKASAYEIETALDPPLYKIASRDLDNLPLIEYVAALGKPMVLSTGMAATLEPIREAVEAIRRHHSDIIVLHCTSSYPTPYDDVGLPAMAEIRERLGVLVGISDHTIGVMVPTVAAVLGACMVEKHVTLSRSMKGTDHACSLEPDGLRRVVRDIRNMEKAMAPMHGCCADPQAVAKLSRSLTSTRAINQGESITEQDLCLKSPGTGIPWRDRDKIIGVRSLAFIAEDATLDREMLTWKDLLDADSPT